MKKYLTVRYLQTANPLTPTGEKSCSLRGLAGAGVLEGVFREGHIYPSRSRLVKVAIGVSDFKTARQQIYNSKAVLRPAGVCSQALLGNVARASACVKHMPVLVGVTNAATFNHQPPRPKPGIHKRPICAAIAGIRSKARVPVYWGKSVCHPIRCPNSRANAKYCASWRRIVPYRISTLGSSAI